MTGDENTDLKPELCQVWTIKLDGVDLRSSRTTSTDPGNNLRPGAGTRRATNPETTVGAGSKLLEDGTPECIVTVEASIADQSDLSLLSVCFNHCGGSLQL